MDVRSDEEVLKSVWKQGLKGRGRKQEVAEEESWYLEDLREVTKYFRNGNSHGAMSERNCIPSIHTKLHARRICSVADNVP